jgi:hypothetical protein
VAPRLSHHHAGFLFSRIGSVEKNRTGLRRNRRFSPTEESQQNQTPNRIKWLGDRVLLVWEIFEQKTLYIAHVLLQILAARDETLASLPCHCCNVLEPPPPRANPTTTGGSPRPAAPVEAFPDARAPPPCTRAATKAGATPATATCLFSVVSAIQGRTR